MRNPIAKLALLFTAAVCPAQFPEIPPSVLPPAPLAFDDGQDPMHARLFQTTTTRAQLDLGGWWDFVTDPGAAGDERHYERNFPAPETRLWVPGTWNAIARYANYTGPAWYRRRFDLPTSGPMRIRFGAVFYLSKVWLDGELLGEHEGGYLPFEYIVPKLARGSHTLTVRVDNRLNDASLPKRNVDWFPYGGPDRPVYAESVPPVFIQAFNVIATSGTVHVRAAIRNLSSGERSVPVSFRVNGRQLAAVTHRAAPGGSTVEFDAVIPEPKFWSPAQPNLYSARLVLDQGADDLLTRFGIREVRTTGGRILLNGEPVKLLGANRHEDHPDWGSSSPPHLLRQDIEIIKRMGANAVRAHYPLPEMFLDFCDQYGILFFSEIPAWQYSAAQLASPEVQAKMMRNFEEMVARDLSHPSVLVWSLGNEWPNPDASYDVVRNLVSRARKADATRLISFVTGGPRAWRVHELLDVICVNWARYQWYDPFTTLDTKEGDQSAADLYKLHQRYPEKPVILTEFGGAEAQGGWHSWANAKWSEEFQARNVEDSGRYALEQDWIAGGCVWQFCDTRSANERFLAGRLHGWNGKGVVDAQRSPKLAFYRLQELFRRWGATEARPSATGGR